MTKEQSHVILELNNMKMELSNAMRKKKGTSNATKELSHVMLELHNVRLELSNVRKKKRNHQM